MIFKIALTIPITAALSAMSLFASPQSMMTAPPQQLWFNSHADIAVAAELKQLRVLTGELNNDADQLTSLVLSDLHWQTHAYHLNQIRDHVNRIGERLEALQAMRSSAIPWQ